MDQKTETDRRIKQMVAFIRQEARDKAEEIQVRAKEECNVEVLKMVDREKSKMREYFKQQEKRIEIENKIGRQKVLDQYRMGLLKSREKKQEELETMFKEELKKATCGGDYKSFLKNSMIQAFIKIWDEDKVVVSCRKEDQATVKGLMKDALSEVKDRAMKETGQSLSMKAEFNDKPVDCTGGVIVTARGGRIICDNTLDARMKICVRLNQPMIREKLFHAVQLSRN